MAKEFPHVDWTVCEKALAYAQSGRCLQGIDLFPFQSNIELPENVQFNQEDAMTGISVPDNYFDLFHARAIVAGVSLSLVSSNAAVSRS